MILGKFGWPSKKNVVNEINWNEGQYLHMYRDCITELENYRVEKGPQGACSPAPYSGTDCASPKLSKMPIQPSVENLQKGEIPQFP